ncbi:MAG TPA: adenylosuccinate lyase family protein [Vicinamibacteria bacterium]|nr:adenylosuccinate lyase family protein [Vicinamibacteria bacterium]
MPASAFDSFYLRDRYGSAAMRAIWDDRATIGRWLEVEAALAATEADLGIVPRAAAREIASRARVELLDLPSMKREFDVTWNPVMPLVNALRAVLTPRSARWVHWGATSKNIIDTGTALQLKDTYDVVLAELDTTADLLAELARRHRDTLMAGRTHGQHALPVTFGYKCAVWLEEVRRQRDRLEGSRSRVLVGEFGGAVGTLASLGRKGLQVQARLMKRLGLGVPLIPSKTAGDRFAEFFILLGMLSATLGKIGQEIYNLQQTDIDEVTEFVEGKVGSSAMPHKLNPVCSGSVLLVGRLLRARMTLAFEYIHCEWEDDHRQGELAWAFAPEVCLLMGAQLVLARRLLSSLVVKPAHMLRNLERAGGTVLSEALMMALAPRVGRDRAHQLVLEMSRQALTGTPFRDVVTAHPEVKKALSPRRLAGVLDYRRSLGLAGYFVDRVLAMHDGERRRRSGGPVHGRRLRRRAARGRVRGRRGRSR